MAHRLLILAGLALAACGGATAGWNKPGVSEAQLGSDLSACRAQYDQFAGRDVNIDHDIRAARGEGLGEVALFRNRTRGYKDERRYERVFSTCMHAGGYSHNAR